MLLLHSHCVGNSNHTRKWDSETNDNVFIGNIIEGITEGAQNVWDTVIEAVACNGGGTHSFHWWNASALEKQCQEPSTNSKATIQ